MQLLPIFKKIRRIVPQYSLLLKVFLLTIILEKISSSEIVINADPDLISSGAEYNGTLWLMLGEEIKFQGIEFSGLIEVRNEKRFNEGLFPNHNWRGVSTLNYSSDSLFPQLPLVLTLGLKHESAHPTMGISNRENSHYEKIYDGEYRRYLLNSINLSIGKNFTVNKFSLLSNMEYQFYFYSKNTPELSGMQNTISNGLSCGVEMSLMLPKITLFLSLFDRIIFEGNERVSGNVYYSINGASRVNYPIMKNVNTFNSKLGVAFNLSKIKRILNIYTSLLYGNIYGFVDSRKKRLTVTFIGLELRR